MPLKKSVRFIDKLGLAIVIISSILLGIWATVNTIALRNILLGVGSLGAIAYWWNWFKTNEARRTLPSLSWMYWLPVMLIGLMFIWVVMHHLFFSQNPQQQFSELKSTWLRSFLAVIIASATGLALNRNPRFMPWLWFGLILSFVVLIYQYIPKAIAKQSLFAVDWFVDYIYWAKFSGVLAGTILIAGLLGFLIDSISQNTRKANGIQLGRNANGEEIQPQLINRIAIPIYVCIGICITFYAFVFIFDAKAGVGMVLILITFWLGVGVFLTLKNVASEQDKKRRITFLMKSLIVFFLVVAGLSWFVAKHIKNNPGWGSLFEDMTIAAQIDVHHHWRATGVALPLRKDGTPVAGNTYERVALGVLGMRLIALNPVGNGSLRSLGEDAKRIEPNYKNHPYTHSAWIDLGLSFGLPGLLFLPITLAAFLLYAVFHPRIRFRATIITLAIAVLILYLVGEYAFQHGIEILLYLCGLIGGLALTVSVNNQNTLR